MHMHTHVLEDSCVPDTKTTTDKDHTNNIYQTCTFVKMDSLFVSALI